MTMLDEISRALQSSGALGQLSTTLGTDESETRNLLSAAGPAVLGALGRQSADDTAGTTMTSLIGADKGRLFDYAGRFFQAGDRTGLASKLVTTVFGGQRSAVENGVSQASGVGLSTVTKLLPLLTPIVMSWLGRHQAENSLDAAGIAGGLGDEFDVHQNGGLAGLLSELDGDDEADRAGFVAGIEELGDAGGLRALIPEEAAAGAHLAGAAGGASAGTAAAVYTGANRTGLGWLLPALLALGGLIVGLTLWQFNNTDERTVTTEVAQEAAPTAVPEPEPEPEPTAVPEPTATPEAAPEPTAAPVVPTLAEVARDQADLSTLLQLAGAQGLAAPLADEAAGPFTIFAPTDAAFGDVAATLERLDPDQVDSTLGFHVVPGVIPSSEVVPGAVFTTLTGERLAIGDDGSFPGGFNVLTADLESSNGVLHIIDGVLIPGSVSRALASSDLNERFALEPIQFAFASAEILPESVPTLDEAVATLTSLPPGSRFEVQGHTDSDGDDAYNLALSNDRAASVVAYLVDNGVDPDMLEPVGYGETTLKVDPELTAEDKATNRRIEFVDIS